MNDATLTLVVAQPLLAQSIYSIFHSSCGPSRIVAMALMGTALPPAQFNLTVTFGSEEVIPVERLFKAFGLENLAIDPNRVLLPLKLPKDLPLEPTIEQFWQYRTGWEAPFDEEYEYRILLPEPAFSRVWEHCLDRLVLGPRPSRGCRLGHQTNLFGGCDLSPVDPDARTGRHQTTHQSIGKIIGDDHTQCCGAHQDPGLGAPRSGGRDAPQHSAELDLTT